MSDEKPDLRTELNDAVRHNRLQAGISRRHLSQLIRGLEDRLGRVRRALDSDQDVLELDGSGLFDYRGLVQDDGRQVDVEVVRLLYLIGSVKEVAYYRQLLLAPKPAPQLDPIPGAGRIFDHHFQLGGLGDNDCGWPISVPQSSSDRPMLCQRPREQHASGAVLQPRAPVGVGSAVQPPRSIDMVRAYCGQPSYVHSAMLVNGTDRDSPSGGHLFVPQPEKDEDSCHYVIGGSRAEAESPTVAPDDPLGHPFQGKPESEKGHGYCSRQLLSGAECGGTRRDHRLM